MTDVETKGKGDGDALPEGLRPRYELHDVRLNRTRAEPTDDRALWVLIRAAAARTSFPEYMKFIDAYMAEPGRPQAKLPFTNVNAYAKLKAGTEAFLETRCGVIPPRDPRRGAPAAEDAAVAAFQTEDLRSRSRTAP